MRNASEDNGAMLVIPPAQGRQGCQRNADKDTSTASAGPLETKFLGNKAKYGNNATGDDKARQGHHVC
jgi:hypothetical protein